MIHLALLIVSTVIVGLTALFALSLVVRVLASMYDVLNRPLGSAKRPQPKVTVPTPQPPPAPLRIDPVAAADVRRRMLEAATKESK